MQTVAKRTSGNLHFVPPAGPATSEDKKEKVRSERRSFHRKFLESKGCSTVDLDIKMAFIRNGNRVVLVFDNQFTRKNGMYVEITDGDHNLVEPGKLYWIRPNAYFAKEFEPREGGAGFYVPIDELEVAIDPEEEQQKQEAEIEKKLKELEKAHEIQDEGKDEHYSKLTIRDLAALLLQKPVSNKGWLNDIIRKHA